MTSELSIATPLDRAVARSLRCGDIVRISGVVYTARDAAHARMIQSLHSSGELPFDIIDQVVYYAGPSPAKPGSVIGSCGPTTAGRMDAFTPDLIDAGLAGMIGKGPRSVEVMESMQKHGAVYFAAVGGAAALTSKSIVEAEVIAYEDLGPEAIRRLVVKDYPCVVAIDAQGTSIYETGPALYRAQSV
ncbi:MAG: Fe-S-containing hydro-lyase [Eggerthellaceae bacterium]|nr:Fe-S-containing hydro-lyase [Eggerthellaceae bacterium]